MLTTEQDPGKIGKTLILSEQTPCKWKCIYNSTKRNSGLCSVDAALQRVGIQHIPDLNSPDAPAACTGVLDCTMDASSFRHSTFRAFLPPELTQRRKSHLKICPNTIVTRIEFTDGAGKLRASGVYFEGRTMKSARNRYYAKARREIILCAGALGSPQILMLR